LEIMTRLSSMHGDSTSAGATSFTSKTSNSSSSGNSGPDGLAEKHLRLVDYAVGQLFIDRHLFTVQLFEEPVGRSRRGCWGRTRARG
jgi:hypothetical protein